MMWILKMKGLQRCGKSCRLRWINYLRPDLKRGSFSSQEAALIIELHSILGNRFVHTAFNYLHIHIYYMLIIMIKSKLFFFFWWQVDDDGWICFVSWQVGSDCQAPTRKNWQWGQELLELKHQEEAPFSWSSPSFFHLFWSSSSSSPSSSSYDQ